MLLRRIRSLWAKLKSQYRSHGDHNHGPWMHVVRQFHEGLSIDSAALNISHAARHLTQAAVIEDGDTSDKGYTFDECLGELGLLRTVLRHVMLHVVLLCCFFGACHC